MPNLERDLDRKKVGKSAQVSRHLEVSVTSLLWSTMSSRLIALTSARISLFSTARRHAITPRGSTRNLHSRRALGYSVEDGLGAFLPPPALKMLAVDLQDGLLQKLNEQLPSRSHLRLFHIILLTNAPV